MDSRSAATLRAIDRPILSKTLLRHVKWEYFAAGISGGVVSTLVLHPLDLVKIRFQGKFFFDIQFCLTGYLSTCDQSGQGHSLFPDKGKHTSVVLA